jgi:hypothetical protein
MQCYFPGGIIVDGRVVRGCQKALEKRHLGHKGQFCSGKAYKIEVTAEFSKKQCLEKAIVRKGNGFLADWFVKKVIKFRCDHYAFALKCDTHPRSLCLEGTPQWIVRAGG